MPERVKTSKITSRLVTSRLNPPRLGSNNGQAVIEYTLILVVTVSLILALSSQLFKPFGDFVSNYMGKYVGCLLEYGELPTLGSDQPSGPDEDSECNKRFAKGTATDGRPPIAGGGGSSSGSKSPSSSGKGNSGNSGDSGNSGTYAGSSSRRGGSNIFQGRRPALGIDGGGGKPGGKVIEIALDGGSGSFFKGSGGSSYQGPTRKTISVPLTGFSEDEKKKIQKKKESGSRTIVNTDGTGPAPKKTLVKKPEVKTVVPDDEPITIGNFMRYLLIAAIIIALLVFLGGQALQMSKSFEK